MKFIRASLFAMQFYISIGVVGFAHLPWALISRRGAVAAVRSWCSVQRFMLGLCGVRTEYRGFENLPEGPCLIAVKHQSTYDTIVPFLFLKDPAFIMKQELLNTPLFGWYCQRSGQIAIDRDGGARTMKQMLQAAKAAAAAGRKVLIFPEGTRQKIGAPPDYKAGVVGLYRALNLPCIPVALNTGLVWPGSLYTGRTGTAVFEALPAIPPGLSRDDFMAALEGAIEPAVARLVAEGEARAR